MNSTGEVRLGKALMAYIAALESRSVEGWRPVGEVSNFGDQLVFWIYYQSSGVMDLGYPDGDGEFWRQSDTKDPIPPPDLFHLVSRPAAPTAANDNQQEVEVVAA
jgi:hypothetical protein